MVVLKKRLITSAAIIRRLRPLVRCAKIARKLMRGSPFSVGFWGVESTGIAPSMLQAFRTQVASASGIDAKGRCATTAIALAFKVDPAIELFSRLLTAFARWSCDVSVVVERLRIAWRAAYELIVQPEGPDFSKVTGPVGAVIASVASVGWFPSSLEVWTSPQGIQWTVSSSSFSKLSAAILRDVEDVLWKLASKHHLGEGLQLSPPADVSFRWVRKLQKDPEARHQLGVLECIMSGGLWLPNRVNKVREYIPDECPRCGQLGCDEMHLFWECPKIDLTLDSVVASQGYLPKVRDGGAELSLA